MMRQATSSYVYADYEIPGYLRIITWYRGMQMLQPSQLVERPLQSEKRYLISVRAT